MRPQRTCNRAQCASRCLARVVEEERPEIASRVTCWRGYLTLDGLPNHLFVTAINFDDLRGRAVGIEVNIAARNLEKSVATVDRLEPEARSREQGPRANAL
jgi:hypothetical protein